MIIQPPPKLDKHWPAVWRDDLAARDKWNFEHHPYCSDGSILIDEKPDGLAMRVNFDATTAIQPLQLISTPTEDDPDQTRVVIGGVLWGGVFIYADPAMKKNENGTTGREFFYVTGLTNNDTIWIELTLSFDDYFYRADSSLIDWGATVPTPDATHAYCPLGTVGETDGVWNVTQPQLVIGNREGQRIITNGTFIDWFPPLN